MKLNLHKFLLSGALFLQGMAVSAQGMDYSLWVGANSAYVKGFTSPLWEYELGFSAEYTFQKRDGWFVEGGIFFLRTQWGFFAPKEKGTLFSSQAKPTHLRFPLNVGYRLFFADNFSMDFAGQAYAGLGLFGREHIEEKLLFDDEKNPQIAPKHETVSNVFNGSLNRFDWGVGLRLGMNFGSHWRFTVTNTQGLKRAVKGRPTDLPKRAGRNSMWEIALGYRF